MPVRPVLRVPHPALKRVARPPASADVERVARDLVDTMRSYGHCVGIAAPQIDEPVRVIAVDVRAHPKATSTNGLLVLVNPRIVEADGTELGREGCLSIPDLTANVRRSRRVVVEARTPAGTTRTLESEGFEARCLQHEIDHLDGILFLDRVDSLAADVFPRRR